MIASPAATVTTTSASPGRPSRLRGLSYLRNYTTERLHSSRSDAPLLTRSISSPNAVTVNNHLPTESPGTTNMATTAAESSTATSRSKEQNPTIRFIPHVEMRSSRPSLHFTAITKTLKNARGMIRVGRYTEKEQNAENEESIPVGFKSKVVSRRHCEFWCTDGQWFVKDVKSSSGTFLNHVRLSSPGQESRPYPVNDGDVVQLGIDFKGGEEVIFRCVKIRIECNRGWQKALNSYNTSTHKKLLNSVGAGKAKRDSDAASGSNHECSICLNPVTPCQCLFVAPCSHVWHYKCIRNLVHGPNYPNFLCPNCRFVADLEADVEQPEEEEMDDELDAVIETEIARIDAEQGAQSSSSEDVVGRMDDDTSSSVALPQDTEVEHIDADLANNTIASSPPAGASATSISATPSRPIPVTNKVGMRRENSPRFVSTPPDTTEESRFRNGAGIVPDLLLTPRNDAGPFILDGAA